MNAFAERTGLSSDHVSTRYLWTDAFALCNFVALAEVTGEHRYLELALKLVDEVHHVLGRHRADDTRRGWLSGLGAAEGELHPTAGGLRIGKPLPERREEEPYDPHLEWERDGQYFHYLTRWMRALDQLARVTRQPRFNTWALELAEAAHRAFLHAGKGQLVWKMSIDLSRPLMPSMGHHDPLDGFVTLLQLRATARELAGPGRTLGREALGDFRQLCARRDWETADPLGIGGLLVDAFTLEQLGEHLDLRDTLIDAAARGLEAWRISADLQRGASHRLAFRELGLAIGLTASARLPQRAPQLDGAAQLADSMVTFWRRLANQLTATWRDHRDIDEVMLATALLPDGYLVLARGTGAEAGADPR